MRRRRIDVVDFCRFAEALLVLLRDYNARALIGWVGTRDLTRDVLGTGWYGDAVTSTSLNHGAMNTNILFSQCNQSTWKTR